MTLINPDTGKEIDIESKRGASSSERIEAANSSETCNEEVVETQPPQQQRQTENDNSLTASTASGCWEIVQPTATETERRGTLLLK